MSPRARVLLLVAIMSGIALGVSAITLSALYSAAFEQQKAWLLETAHSQARLVEAIARHEELKARRAQDIDDRDDPFTTTLETIREAHEQFEGFGQTGEFTLGRRERDQIVFLLSHRHADLDDPQAVPFSSELAEPMRLAVSGLSGTIVGIDYRGETVLAAHEPVKAFDLGIVAKIDLVEVRAPFIKAGVFAACGAGGLIFFGMAAFLRIGNPIVRRLEESEKRYREVVETTDDLVTRVDGDGRFVYVNHTAETVFGVKPEACLGFSAFDFVHREDRTRTREWFDRCVQEQVSGATIENGQVSRTGEVRRMLWTSNFHFDDSGRVIVVNTIARDITECKRAEKVLQDAHDRLELRVKERTSQLSLANETLRREITERKRVEEELRAMEAQLAHVARVSTVGEMVAGIVHEVNQPLCSIQNFAQASDNVLAAKKQVNLDDLREWNTAIGKAALRATEIVKRLRGFVVRAESQPSASNINEIVEEAVQLVTFEAGRHQTTARMKLPELSPLVQVDRVEIQQVLVNLLQNAYEAMGDVATEVREVIIHVEQAGESVEVSVADNGPGLPPEDDLRMFDAFVTSKQDGLGIGLAIGTTIIESHGGKLWATSNENGGATFHFTLPVAREKQSGAE